MFVSYFDLKKKKKLFQKNAYLKEKESLFKRV